MELSMTEEVVTTGAIRHAKLWSKSSPPTNQHPTFTGRMPFLSPHEQCQSTEGNDGSTLLELFYASSQRHWSDECVLLTVGSTAESDILRVVSGQHVDDSVCVQTEDSWETAANRRLRLQAQISLHEQRRRSAACDDAWWQWYTSWWLVRQPVTLTDGQTDNQWHWQTDIQRCYQQISHMSWDIRDVQMESISLESAVWPSCSYCQNLSLQKFSIFRGFSL